MAHYRTIVISDLHIGSSGCQADLVNDFLKQNTSDILILNGDIIDAWKIQQNRWKFTKAQGKLLRRILKISLTKTRVTYVLGNHDDFFRTLLPYKFDFGKIKLCNHCEHHGLNGKRYLITHGDLFDGVTRLHRWLSFLGDNAYEAMFKLNQCWNWGRKLLGLHYWSLSAYLKKKVKKAVDFIYEFENNLSGYCKSKGYDGVICGHIHTAEIKELQGVTYMNSGDWVESCTALVETLDGEWQIIHWNRVQEDVVAVADSGPRDRS
jgi:UDP-2,3-diacylglucosamine pyrophosphatase LpxH